MHPLAEHSSEEAPFAGVNLLHMKKYIIILDRHLRTEVKTTLRTYMKGIR